MRAPIDYRSTGSLCPPPMMGVPPLHMSRAAKSRMLRRAAQTVSYGNDASMLESKRVLIVEDEALVAMDIEYALEDLGAHVLGPAPSLQSAMDLVSTGAQIDGAILDIDLGREDVFPAAALLHQRGVPFVFHTGHNLSLDMQRMFPGVTLCTKPMKMERLLSELACVMPDAA